MVVAFDHDRKTWNIESKRETSLAMLRELYVAVTRAQRRVVILVKEDIPAMAHFFESLECDLEATDNRIFKEFDRDTSAEEWFDQAQRLYKNHQFSLAAPCFTRANRQDWSLLARGRDFLECGLKIEAERDLRRAARIFYEGRFYDEILVIFQILLGLTGGRWDPKDDKIFLDAITTLPATVPRRLVVRYSILREDFSSVHVSDLKDHDVCQLIMKYRHEQWLKNIVADCSPHDRQAITSVMPMVVFDFHMAQEQYLDACRVALSARDFKLAETPVGKVLATTKEDFQAEVIVSMAELWKEAASDPGLGVLPRTSHAVLLGQLFSAPKQLSSSTKALCTSVLGKEVVLLAVDRANLERTELLDFGPKKFSEEVDAYLVHKFERHSLKVVQWYDKNGHPALASKFALERVAQWSHEDLMRIAISLWSRPDWLLEELRTRKLLDAVVVLVVRSPAVGDASKIEFIRNYNKFNRIDPDSEQAQDMLEKMKLQCERDLERVLAQMTIQWQLLEKVFLHMWLDSEENTAVQCSWDAIESHELAAANVVRLLRFWNERRAPNWSKCETETFDDKFSLLMCFFFGDAPTEEKRSFYLCLEHKFFSLLQVFGPTVAAYCRMSPAKARNDDDSILQGLFEFHEELRSKCNMQNTSATNTKESQAGTDSATSKGKGAAGSRTEQSETKPLSKKAARKMKQRQPKAGTLPATTIDSGIGTNTSSSRKQNNKKRNNKKKRGRR